MSLVNDDPADSTPNRKAKEAPDYKKTKKRKRQAQDESEPPSTVKKHKSVPIPEIPDTSLNVPAPDENSPFHQQTSSLYLPLPPIAQSHPLQGICAEHLSPLILTYYPPLRGVIISFHNTRLSTKAQHDSWDRDEPVLAQAIDEYAALHVWVTVDFLLFRPKRGNAIEGWINLQNEGNIGLVCWNFFNATIERKRLPKDWRWIPGGLDLGDARRKKKKLKGSERSDPMDVDSEDSHPHVNGVHEIEGHFEDGDGRRIHGLLHFLVKDVESSRNSGGDTGFLSIEGTLLGEAEERRLRESETGHELSRKTKHVKKRHVAKGMSSAVDPDSEEPHMSAEKPEKSRRRSVY